MGFGVRRNSLGLAFVRPGHLVNPKPQSLTPSDPVDLPKATASAKTDADGAFSVDLPADGSSWLLIAQSARRVGGTNPWESYEWRVTTDGSERVLLTGANASSRIHKLRIATE